MSAPAVWRPILTDEEPSTHQATPDELAALVASYASAGGRWRPYVRYTADQRWYLRLLWTPAYEVWLITWAVGQAVDLHDHGDSAGAFVVTQGALREQHLDADRLRRVRCGPGMVRSFPPGHVHTVSNTGPRAATSIHAYSPPLRMMTFFERGGMSGLQRTRVELVTKR
jgi:predicted metal-dependent enzyme (double-stranded beta helix superfamily)